MTSCNPSMLKKVINKVCIKNGIPEVLEKPIFNTSRPSCSSNYCRTTEPIYKCSRCGDLNCKVHLLKSNDTLREGYEIICSSCITKKDHSGPLTPCGVPECKKLYGNHLCSDCNWVGKGVPLCEYHYKYCLPCGEEFCYDCFENHVKKCDLCGNKKCSSRCLFICGHCGDSVCESCVYSCMNCDDYICKKCKHFYKCNICKDKKCNVIVNECTVCGINICEECISDNCPCCSEYFCINCYKNHKKDNED